MNAVFEIAKVGFIYTTLIGARSVVPGEMIKSQTENQEQEVDLQYISPTICE